MKKLNLISYNVKVCRVASIKAPFLLLFVVFINFVLTGYAQSFDAAVVSSEIFPLPTKNLASVPMTPSGTFYETRYGGSCYNQTFDFDGRTGPFDSGDEDVYVWSICHQGVEAYGNAVAYKVINKATGTLLYRGTQYIGADITDLQVGIYRINTNYHLVVAYWTASNELRLGTYRMTVTGLAFVSDVLVATYGYPNGLTQHLALDCHDLNSFTIAWEDRGVGIFVKAYEVVAGTLTSSPNSLISAGSSVRLPDVAMSHNMSTGAKDIHVCFIDTFGGSPVIGKMRVDFNLLMAGTLAVTLEDVLTLTGMPFGSRFDQFQLKIDAPDHYTSINSNWTYAFYNNDANKIKIRMCNYSLATPINSYVVNDGTLSGSSGAITSAGNAYPTVTYHPDGDKVYVGWFTTYAPSLPAPTLYVYQNTSQRYISVIVDDNGNQVGNRYQRIDANYMANYIYNYAKVCFSKNNDGDNLFCIFACHGPTQIWPYWGGTAFTGTYYENSSVSTYTATHPPVSSIIPANLNYTFIDPLDALTGGTSLYICNKATPWYSGTTPFFRKTKQDEVVQPLAISVASNPFSQSAPFKLLGGDNLENYNAFLTNSEGKQVSQFKGSITELNDQFNKLNISALASGVYFLKLESNNKNDTREFKLLKQ